MTADTLHSRARKAGIEVHWVDAQGTARTLADDTVAALLDLLADHDAEAPAGLDVVRAGMPLDDASSTTSLFDLQSGREVPLITDTHGRALAPEQPGYYAQAMPGRADRQLAVAPLRCRSVADLTGCDAPRSWGVAVQVYGLRSDGNGGLGGSLAACELGQRVSEAGGSAVALSPLHAHGPIDAHFSPYSPSHRAWLDTLQVAPYQITGNEAFQDALEHSGQTAAWAREERRPRIDWIAQDRMRQSVWKSLFTRWGRAAHIRRQLDFFVQRRGPALTRHAAFVVRQRQARERGESTDWRRWRHHLHGDLDALAREHAEDVQLECFAQWLTAACWDDTQRRLREQGQAIGLIWDLAAGFSPSGSEAWQHRHLVVSGARLGAPPDAFNPDGQDWGLAAYAPHALRRCGYQPIRDLLARMMSRGGGLRIDHILGWARVWLVPEGRSPREGGYVRYPLHDLLGLLALESWLRHAVVIGEDLGTVPPDLRATLAASGVMGMDVLPFCRDAPGRFLDPSRWRSDAVAMSSTHDLPPLEGWREGCDIEQLSRIQQWPEPQRIIAKSRRAADIAQLDRMLARFRARTPRQAALRAVAASPSPLALFPLEDLLGEREQPNLPGTLHHQHPNWRRRLNWRRPRLAASLRLVARQRKAVAHA
ncbi:4-alpha-glucanotransferase [Dyella jiangningensis]|uniref:4-alpha-glucanotransferase n=1 Tax=Dyella sp. AtDHG13 TaxID=1938897 RepID=UPI00087F6F01|nr:4-alpha-glucanotransferase [Dyella sp. AtDHG13]PXV55873.1 4-alpha-glucanotransferase [Dyella sp. AtDHG13]SDK52829.1 4-alpha-glucanotransferase [Dyella jiangningensis]